MQRAARFRRRGLGLAATLALSALLAACGSAGGTSGPDGVTFKLGDTSISVPDTSKDMGVSDSLPADASGDTATGDGQPDVSTTITAVAIDVTPTLAVAARSPLAVTVKRVSGSDGAPSASEKVSVRLGGSDFELGAQLAGDGQAQPAVNVWKGASADKFWIAGARPGTVTVQLVVDGVASAPVSVTVAMPSKAGLALAMPTATGASTGSRSKDSDDTIRIDGKQIGAGGMTLTVRFPAAAKAGDMFELDKTSPIGGSLQVSGTIADLSGLKVSVPKGRLFIDQVEKGWFRGTVVGTSASLNPVVCAFQIPRDGGFGVDLLDDAQQLASSTTIDPSQTGIHVSRASISAIGGGLALITWRRVEDVLKGSYPMATVDVASGAVTPVDPLVPLVHAKVLTDDGQGGYVETPTGEFMGWSAAAQTGGVRGIVWEGKASKGSSPYGIYASLLGPDFKPQGAVLKVSDAGCWGQCRPSLAPLPSTRWLAVWNPPDGSVQAAILDGLDLGTIAKTASLAQAPASMPTVAAFDADVGVIWQDPQGAAQYRLYSDTLSANGTAQDLGMVAATTPRGSMVAMASPTSFGAVFFDTSNTLRWRRIGLNAAFVTAADLQVDTEVLAAVAVAGKPGQVAIVERRAAAANEPQLYIRKIVVTSPSDGGANLGPAVALPQSLGKMPLQPSLCYSAETDSYVVAWSGDKLSDGVWLQRFR